MKHFLLSVFAFTSLVSFSQPVVKSPNGGESLSGGTTHTIKWNPCLACIQVNNTIEYSINNGSTWTLITSSVADAAGSYLWSVPATPSTQCRIKITNATASDQSDNVFTIKGPAGFADNTLLKKNISIYPNPTTNDLTITNSGNVKIESVQVYNLLGEMVRQYALNIDVLKSNTVSLLEIPAGVYFVGVDGGKASEKVVVTH